LPQGKERNSDIIHAEGVLDALWVGMVQKKVNWVLDPDIRGFLDTASYCPHGC
jgi:hypothetical protein